MNTYLLVKSLHQACALATIVLFVVRGLYLFTGPDRDRPRWMYVLPHVVDTVLLASAVTLVVLTHQYPGETAWLNAKLVALVIYIGLGLVAFRFGRHRAQRITAWLAGVAVVGYIVAVALTRSPMAGLG